MGQHTYIPRFKYDRYFKTISFFIIKSGPSEERVLEHYTPLVSFLRKLEVSKEELLEIAEEL